MSAVTPQSARQVLRRGRVRAGLFAVLATVLAVGGGLVGGMLAQGGHVALVAAFAAVLVPFAVWRWPEAGLVCLLFGTTTIEQFEYSIGPGAPGVFTDKIPFFHSISSGTFITPAELLMALILLVWIMKGAVSRTWRLPRSRLAAAVLAMYSIVVLVGMGLGIARHGRIQTVFWEVRPWYYVAVMYLLVSTLFAGRNVIRIIMWTVVLGSGFKSLQGTWVYFTVARHMLPRPEAILGHEESFFFAMFLFITLGLWVWGERGPLRRVATALLPFVVIADLGNARRTAFLLIYVGVLVFMIVAYACLEDRRKTLKRVNVAMAVIAILYLGAFWNHGGAVGEPARAIQSAVAPSARDKESDQYRYIENANLVLNIHNAHSIGRGFGIPIDYAYTITNLTGIDPAIAFIPHDGVLYLWFRLGILGEAIFWIMLGFGVLAALALTRERDRDKKLLGALAACGLISYVLIGYDDMGFFWARIAIFVGFLLGAVEAARTAPSTDDGVAVADPVETEDHRELTAVAG